MANRKAVTVTKFCPFGSRCLCRALGPKQHQQWQVLHRLMAGQSEKQVARGMEISRHTVDIYITKLHHRFHVCSRGELMALAMTALSTSVPDSSPGREGKSGHH